VGLFLNGQEFTYRDRQGRPIVDDSFLLLFNAHHEDVTFTLPSRRYGERWTLELSTAEPERPAGDWSADARQEVHTRCRSVTVLRRDTPDHRSPEGSHDDQASNPEIAPGEAVD
jgi:glycogen operon protein